MTSENLLAIVDFLYYGEANIYQFRPFLNIAEEFKLKGLHVTSTSFNPSDPSSGTQRKHGSFTSQTNSENQDTLNTAVALPNHEFSGDLMD